MYRELIARILTDQAYNEIYSSASYAGKDSIYDSVLTVTGGSNKWCSPWLTSADGGATEESLRRQRTVNPRNCGSPCASRDPGPEYWKLHLTLPYTHCRPPFANQPSPRYLWASPRCVYNRPQSFLDASRYYTVCPFSTSTLPLFACFRSAFSDTHTIGSTQLLHWAA